MIARVCVTLGLALTASAACAQEITRAATDERQTRERELRLSQQSPRALIDNAVVQRLRPGYDPVGVPLGGFRAYPRIDVRLGYDTNVLQLPVAESDETLAIRPSLSIRSDWERHSLSLDTAASIERFAQHGSENLENYDAALNGTLDFGRGGHLHALGRVGRNNEDRGSIGDLFPGGRPVRYDRTQLAGGVEEHLPGMFVALDGDFARYRYDAVRYQGVTFAQDYRDRNETRVTGQVAFRIAPRMALFTEVSANDAAYRDKTAGNFSSHGASILAGLTFQIPALLSGELGIGYVRQKYAELPLGPVYGLTYDLAVLWNATPLLTATAEAHRSIQQTPYVQAPSIIETRFGLKLDYELLRNILINAQGALTLDRFGAGVPVDRRTNASLGVRYLIDRTFSADLTLEMRKQKARSSFIRPYDGAAVRLGLTAQR